MMQPPLISQLHRTRVFFSTPPRSMVYHQNPLYLDGLRRAHDREHVDVDCGKIGAVMDATDQSPALPTRPQLTKIPIAQLSPTLEQREGKCIYATVTLVWPYSSSTKSLSLLLAEPDFRLRRSNGQVKATFHGRVAEKVAGSHIGIGDTVRLSLSGSSFVANDAATQTYGRCVAWDMHFDTGVTLEIVRSSQSLPTVIIEQDLPSPPDNQPPSTPRLLSIDPDTASAPSQGSWGSPAFYHSARKSFGRAVDSAFDPFANEDGSIPGEGRKRPRYSLRRDEWRIVDEPGSPQEREETVDWMKALEDEMDIEADTQEPADAEPNNDTAVPDASDAVNQTNIDDPFEDQSPVFVKPSLDFSGGLFGRHTLQLEQNDTSAKLTGSGSQAPGGGAFNIPTDTPQLRPVPSPGLPIPSPLVSNQSSSQGYFSPFHAVPPVHDVHHAPAPSANAAFQARGFFGQISPGLHPQEAPALTGAVDSLREEEAISIPLSSVNHHQAPISLRENSILAAGAENVPGNLGQFDSPSFVNESHFVQTDTWMEKTEELNATASKQHTDGEPWTEEQKYPEEANGDGIDIGPGLETREHGKEVAQAINDPLVLQSMDLVEDESGDDASRDAATEGEGLHVPEITDISDRSRSGSYSNESDAEDEVLYDEDQETSHLSEDGSDEEQDQLEPEGEDEIAGTSGYEDSDAAELPPSQPEIIVLDSDSEDELVSEQPLVTPEHPIPQGQHSPLSSVHSENSNSPIDDDGEEWSVVNDDPEYDTMEDEMSADDEGGDEYGALGQDDRVHDGDKDDESSVDVLARDDYSDKHFTRNRSIEEDVQSEDHLDSDGDGEQGWGDGVEVEPKSVSVIELALHEDLPDHPNEEGFAKVEELPDWESQEGSKAALHGEGQTSGRSLEALISLDGVDDQDWPEFSDTAKTNDETPYGKDMQAQGEPSEPQEMAVVSETQGVDNGLSFISSGPTQMELAEQQLLTHDATQKVISVRRSAPDNVKSPESAVANEQTSPAGLDASSRPVFKAFDPSEQQDNADSTSVALPTAEATDAHDQPSGQRDGTEPMSTGKVSEYPKVVVGETPVPDRHAHGLRSKLSYFAPLATLVDHFNALVDTISIVYEVSPIAKATSGSRDYFMTIQLTDPSMAGTTLQARVFRRYKSAMPSVAEGNAILLRDFKVQSNHHSMMLVSTESSSWAVFDGSSPEAKITGPPVEYSSAERAFASGLRRWYSEDGADMVADNQLQASIGRDSHSPTPSSVAASDAGSMDGTPSVRGSRRFRRSRGRVTIHELRDGTRYTEVGSPSGKHGIHELRDGTVYANL
ncbi:uncharacterized protein N7482_002712 [Penicillium canariense]|uniref:Telomeric single stranded DNA binding POT1/Cdc13 domain-containing protein n=1 Tax=Penicillium canariense TaxID=189055 RepID=A0A9W9IGK2_9EURO|nr:uncharacterized protein N7482_002712 [Penicillium canariense]KAJ5176835.1 hypothetical protein N7482_002712 [Penicillium canariense]